MIDWSRQPQFKIRTDPKNPGIRQKIVQYSDEPGAYYDEGGRRCSDQYAIDAGFNVGEDRVFAQRNALAAKAEAEIATITNRKIAAIRDGRNPDEDMATANERFNVVVNGDGTYNVADPHGQVVGENLPFDEAVDAVASANDFEAPTIKAEVFGNNRPKGTFIVQTVSGQVVAEALTREEAENLVVQAVNGAPVTASDGSAATDGEEAVKTQWVLPDGDGAFDIATPTGEILKQGLDFDDAVEQVAENNRVVPLELHEEDVREGESEPRFTVLTPGGLAIIDGLELDGARGIIASAVNGLTAQGT